MHVSNKIQERIYKKKLNEGEKRGEKIRKKKTRTCSHTSAKKIKSQTLKESVDHQFSLSVVTLLVSCNALLMHLDR